MDTIRIKIANYQIEDKHYFREIKASAFCDDLNYRKQYTNNQFRKKLQEQGEYTPLYFVDENNYFGKQQNSLILEFSAPKLIYGHNFAEVKEKDLHLVIEKIKQFLSLIKVKVWTHEIEKAIVTRIAYTKNIVLDDLCHTSDVLQVLSVFNYRPKSQFTATTRNANSEIKFFNNHSHFCIYDKLLEIKNNPKTKEEKELVKKLLPEVVRFELTLHTKHSVNQAMRGFYPKQNDYTLVDVFKDEICAKLLQNEVDQIFNHPLKEVIVMANTKQPFNDGIFQKFNKYFSKKTKTKYILDLLQTRGVAGFRKEFLESHSVRTWYRLQNEVGEIAQSLQLTGDDRTTTNLKILEFILEQFGIKPDLKEPVQQSLFPVYNHDNISAVISGRNKQILSINSDS